MSGAAVSLLGAGFGGRPTLAGATVNHTVPGGAATAGLRFNTNGTLDRKNGTGYTALENWLQAPAHAPGPWQVRVTVTAGSALTTGTAGTWQALTSSREFTLSRTGSDASSTLTVELGIGSVALASNTYILEAEGS